MYLLQAASPFDRVAFPQAWQYLGREAGRKESLANGIVQVAGQALALLYGGERLRLFVKPDVLDGHRRLIGKGQRQISLPRRIVVAWLVVLEGQDAHHTILDHKWDPHPGADLTVYSLEPFAAHFAKVPRQRGVIPHVGDDDRLLTEDHLVTDEAFLQGEAQLGHVT